MSSNAHCEERHMQTRRQTALTGNSYFSQPDPEWRQDSLLASHCLGLLYSLTSPRSNSDHVLASLSFSFGFPFSVLGLGQTSDSGSVLSAVWVWTERFMK